MSDMSSVKIRFLSTVLLCLLLLPAIACADHEEGIIDNACIRDNAPLSPREIEHRVLDINPGESVSLHRLSYAIVGTNDAKMQFSFKFRLAEGMPLYFAYTNLALWDIWETSSPFNDINFIPELFYRFDGGTRSLISVDLGYIHTSNGKDKELSRTWDRAALRINTFFTPGPMHLVWITSLYAPLTTGKENKDIDHYLGYWDSYMILRGLLGDHDENLDLELALHSGKDSVPFQRGNFSIALKYHLPTENFRPYLYAQYFKGYGETLLTYDQADNQFRAGLAFFY